MPTQNSTATCLQCGATFTPQPGNARRGGGIYCSQSCYRLRTRKPAITLVCGHCGCAFERTQGYIARGHGQFCSRDCAREGRRLPITTRFWAKAHSGDGCWEWHGSITKGYGMILFEGRNQYAHRVAWILTNGPIPDGLQVCHRCDNPLCVRPDHLFLGTVSDNMQDMYDKGRGNKPQGASHPNAKLTDDQVEEIRRRAVKGNYKTLAREFGVTFPTIRCVVDGTRYRRD